jgi:uncharacterized membrane protein required for colicin V production
MPPSPAGQRRATLVIVCLGHFSWDNAWRRLADVADFTGAEGCDMHWFDWTILALLTAAVVLGACSGLVKQVFRVVGFALGGYATVALHGWASAQLAATILEDADPYIISTTAYGVVFAVVCLAVALVSRLTQRGVKAAKLQFYNRLFGATLAAAKMTVLLASVCYVMQRVPVPQTQKVVEESAMAPVLVRGAEQIVGVLPEHYKPDVSNGWEQVTEKLPASGVPPDLQVTDNLPKLGDALPKRPKS